MIIDEKFLEQKWQSLTIRDNFIFSRVMEENPNLCRRLIEMILNVKILKLNYPEREKTIESRLDSKGIRLDVYVEDSGGGRSFDVEMQICDSVYLAKRIRYYQGLIDVDRLKRGQHYGNLNESYIIFICPFDHFHKGRHIYTFREHCSQDPTILLGDGTVKVFLNTKGTLDDVSAEIKDFLDYVDKNIVAGNFVKELDTAVRDVKSMKKARLDFMTLEMHLKEREMAGLERGREEGRKEGRREGRKEATLEMIKSLVTAGTPLEYIVRATGWSEEKILEARKLEAKLFAGTQAQK